MTTSKHDVDDWLDNIDPATMRDATSLRAIGQALTELEQAEAKLKRTIADAKNAGESWNAIALVLGTSRQAAHRKWAEAVKLPKKTADKSFGFKIVGAQGQSRNRRGVTGQASGSGEASKGRSIPNSK